MDRIEVKISLVIVIIALTLILILGFKPQAGVKEVVTNPNEFYTASSCVGQYYSYLATANTDALMTILDKKYIEKNNINKSNIISKLDGDNIQYVFSPSKAYKIKVSENVDKYYIKGIKQKELMDVTENVGEEKYEITLYHQNSTFTINPYTGKI